MDKRVTFLTEKQIDKNQLLRRLKDDSVKVSKSDNVEALEKKILKIEHRLYPKAIYKFLINF